MTTGATKADTIGKQLAAASTEDGSGFYNVDTSAGAFTTTLDVAVVTGQQLRFKQANGSWKTNAWTLTTPVVNGLKILSSAGVAGSGVSSLTFNSVGVGEVVAEWDGTVWQVAQLSAVLGGAFVRQSLTVATRNTIPALSSPWNGQGVPSIVVNGNTYFNGAGVTFTANSTAVTVNAATLGFNINVGEAVVAEYNV